MSHRSGRVIHDFGVEPPSASQGLRATDGCPHPQPRLSHEVSRSRDFPKKRWCNRPSNRLRAGFGARRSLKPVLLRPSPTQPGRCESERLRGSAEAKFPRSSPLGATPTTACLATGPRSPRSLRKRAASRGSPRHHGRPHMCRPAGRNRRTSALRNRQPEKLQGSRPDPGAYSRLLHRSCRSDN